MTEPKDDGRYYRGIIAGALEWRVDVITPGSFPDKRASSVAPLAPRLDLMNHSPSGFAWGYGGSGPAQLALAMLADALGDDARALALHQAFKSEVVAGLAKDRPWDMYAFQLVGWAEAHAPSGAEKLAEAEADLAAVEMLPALTEKEAQALGLKRSLSLLPIAGPDEEVPGE
jgi:hypothetical protein